MNITEKNEGGGTLKTISDFAGINLRNANYLCRRTFEKFALKIY